VLPYINILFYIKKTVALPVNCKATAFIIAKYQRFLDLPSFSPVISSKTGLETNIEE
jgi:hypothetical protein